MACFAAFGQGQLAVIDGTMDSDLYQQILKKNVRTSVCELNHKRTWVMQQNQRTRGVQFILSPEFIPIEMLQKDLKQAVHWQKPTSIIELRLFCMEE